MARKPDFGIDAPGVVRALTIAGVAVLVVSLVVPRIPRIPHGLAVPLHSFWYSGLALVLAAVIMVWSSRTGKLRLAHRMLAMHSWRGTEQVLDVGCGRGLALITAAANLGFGGKATGIDLWSAKDLSGNAPERTLANAAIAGVAARVAVDTGDARKLPYPDGTFDVVTSMTALHNIPDEAGRAEALRECARVLKPGGRLLIFDIMHPFSYLAALRRTDLVDVKRAGTTLLWVLPGTIISARKPA